MSVIIGKQLMQRIRRTYTRGTDGRAVIVEEAPVDVWATVEDFPGDRIKDREDGSVSERRICLIADPGTFQRTNHNTKALGDVVVFASGAFAGRWEIYGGDGPYEVIIPHEEVYARYIYRQ